MSIHVATHDAGPHSGSKHRTKKFARVDADERRLLGDYGDEEKSGATAIVPPGRRVRPEAMGNKALFAGGVVPRNTLKNSFSQQPGKGRISKPRDFGTRTTPLKTYAKVGDNVRTPLADPGLDPTREEYANGNAKRLKRTHYNEAEEIDSDELDAQDPRSVKLSHKPLKYSVNGAVSQDAASRKALGLMTQHNTNIDNASLRSFAKRSDSHVTLDVKGDGPIDLSSDIEDDETSPDITSALLKSLETSTGQVLSSPINATNTSSVGEQSKYFDKTFIRNQACSGNKSPILPRPSRFEKVAHDLSTSLVGQFVDVEGRKRGHQSSSPDALSGEKTIGGMGINTLHIPPSPSSNRHQSRSPKKRVEVEPWNGSKETYSSECEPSIIPHLTFKSGRRQEMSSPPTVSRVNKDGESELQWNAPLSAIVCKGQYREEKGLRLIYSKSRQAYTVKQNALDLSAADPSLTLYPTKLNKIIHDSGGRRMRFESARIGNSDHRMDVRMSSEKDAWSLIQRLESETKSLSIKEESPDRMESMFKKRFDDRRPETKNSANMQDEMPDDIKLIEANRNRRRVERDHGRMPSLDEHKQQQQKQQRQHGSRVVDRMNSRSAFSQEPLGTTRGTLNPALGRAAEKKNEASVAYEPSHVGRTSGKAEERRGNANDPINNRLAKPHDNDAGMEHRYHDDTRALRSRVQAEEGPSIWINRMHAKTQKWGKRWAKPLTFPHTGPKKTTVEWDDLDRLEEDQFFNDNLIAFYLRYLEEKLRQGRPNIAKKVYIFNSYFFASLTNSGARTINYNAVKNWTRNIDLLSYDYIVVPINEAFHWYCAVICNLTALPRKLGSEEGSPSEILNEAQADVADAADVAGHGEERYAVPDSENESQGKNQPQVEEEKEKEARSSFAELSLEPKDPERRDSTRGQANAVMSLSNTSEIDREALEARVEELNRVGQNAGASQATKRGKRKSLPPKRIVNPASPAIVTFDSLEQARAPAIRSLKDYVKAEAEAKRGGMAVDVTLIKGMTAKDIPRQPNASDCGPIMLRYIEKLLEDPKGFVSRTLSKEFDLKNDWPTAQTEGMRDKISTLIKQLHDEQTDTYREEAKRLGKYRKVRSGGDATASSPGHSTSANPTSNEQNHSGGTANGSVPKTNDLLPSDRTPTDAKSVPELKNSTESPLAQHLKKTAPQSPESDHSAAASRSSSAGEKVLQPHASSRPSNANGNDEINALPEALPHNLEVREPQMDSPILVDSQSQPVKGSTDQAEEDISQRGLSAYQVMLQKKAALAQTQKSVEKTPIQAEAHIQVADSQPEAEPHEGRFESLFEEGEDNLEDIDELQDSIYDQRPTNGPWARGYSAQPTVQSPKKRKASQSPVASSPLRDVERRAADEEDDEQDQANQQLQDMQFEQMPPGRTLRSGGGSEIAPHQLLRAQQDLDRPAKKRGRKKNKVDSEQKSSPPVIYELSD